MATPFSEQERVIIDSKLKEAAKQCLAKYGVKKTTVDQLVQMTGISKGSFYNFYSGKEVLFFKVLEEYQETMIEQLVAKFSQEEEIGIELFTESLFELYSKVRRSFLMTIIQNQEMDYLMRKIPKELIINHHSLDVLFLEKVFSQISLQTNVNLEIVSASLRAIFVSMLHVTEIGEKDFDAALKLLINGLALQIIAEECSDA